MYNELQSGIYDVFGNTVEYEGGNYGFDIDANLEIPAEVIATMGCFISTFDSYEDNYYLGMGGW